MKNEQIYGFLLQKMWPKTDFAQKSLKNFLESGVFTMGRSIYLKHEYFFLGLR